ncbi:MAG TPA: carboxypeptidase regulatory-like domain-containing protein [Thermoanaerobaculia bacterium]|nr:carboxypeptidase regulatory-like domain-containing protein [Thermoanaerobaculia bacterium]
MLRNKLRVLLCLCAFLPVVATLAACGGGTEEGTPEAAQAPAGPPVDLTDAGGVKGVIRYTGPDTDTRLPLEADPVCSGLHKDGPVDSGAVVAKDGQLANAFVYVKSGLEGKSFPVPAEAKLLDQQGCIYTPRVLGVQVGQTLKIKNSDPTLHNVSALPKVNGEFNESQPIPGMEFDKKFDKPEVMVHFKCNVHPWMTAFVGVLPHPYFAVTGENGAFDLAKLPPGTYTLEAWHESLGTQTQQVTVAPNQTAEVTFEFPAAASPAAATGG